MMEGVYNSDGSVNSLYLEQQMCQAAVTRHGNVGDVPAFFALVGGGDVVRTFFPAPNILEPSFWIWRQGANLFVGINATDLVDTNANHIWADIMGYMFTNLPAPSNDKVHEFFNRSGQSIALAVAAAINGLSPARITSVAFAGFSYGGSVSLWASILLKRRMPGLQITAVSFGGPKLSVGPIPGIMPDSIICVDRNGDIVAQQPADALVLVAYLRNPLTFLTAAEFVPVWQRPGRQFILTPTSLPEQRNPWNRPGMIDFGSSLERHYQSEYLRTIISYRQNTSGVSFETNLDRFTRYLSEQTYLPDVDIPPARRFPIPIDTINTAFLGSDSPSSPLTPADAPGIFTSSGVITSTTLLRTRDMGAVMPIIPGAYYKITYFARDDIFGDSISLYCAQNGASSAVPPPDMINNIGLKLNKMFGNNQSTNNPPWSTGNARLSFIRITKVGTRRQAQLANLATIGLYNSQVWATTRGTFLDCGSNAFVNGVALRLRSIEPNSGVLSDSTLWIPSTPDPVAFNGIYDGTRVNVSGFPGQNYDNQILDLATNLIVPQPANGGWLWGHMGKIQPPGYIALGNATSASGKWVISYIDVPTFAEGDLIQISSANVRQWNASYRVQSIDLVGKTFTLAKGPPLSQQGFTSAKAQLWRTKAGLYNQSFYQYVPFVDASNVARILSAPPRLSSHRPARAFTGVSFRRSRRVARVSL
jgi:hypothetical protein